MINGQEPTDVLSTYADLIEDITTGEDIEAELSAQEQLIQELKIALQNKTAGSAKPNLYVQLTEPTSKDGIWLQTDKEVDEIIADENVYADEEWNTAKASSIPSDASSGFYFGNIVTDNHTIYLIGSEGSNSKIRVYNINSGEVIWKDLPFSKSYGISAYYDGSLYLFGSIYGNDDKTAYKYDIDNDSFEKLTDIPVECSYSEGTIVDDDIYLFGLGGYNSRYNIYKYNITLGTYTYLNRLPTEVTNGAAVVAGDSIYVFGKKIYKYNYKTNSITTISDFISSYGWIQGVLVGKYIYLFAYSKVTTAKGEIYKYDINADTFEELDIVSDKNYSGSGVCLVDSDIYIIGGNNENTWSSAVLSIPSKTYTDKSIIISQGFSKYKTELFNSNITNGINVNFNDVYYYTTQDGFDDTIPTYYGNGTSWVKFKNPPVNNE